ncbi:MAG: AzlC family ABC transporter permease [Absicoccus porci]|uniref:AzlC family ABC transporter permease n=1 Tax=Absicoccus porci TaxID=2486576 RepID=UPI0023F4BAA0|nr:AzlC family ABC transporter permease [Absicoccus porci]MDD7331037.1 AzlC family ABC transporter permease [Absicoccus porci]MDY4737997.1 AzlC family ABC transporter permease [Absicoccus porci]
MNKRTAFQTGLVDAIPIMLGYFAVGFSLGIAAKNAGLNSLQGFFISFFCNASAGEYVAFTVIAAHATYLEMVFATLITNARYFLMSASLAQRLDANTSLFHRLLIAYDVTDELFGIGIAKIHTYGPFYMYGAYTVALPGWAFGTMFGVIAGNILPSHIVTALGVALYGMFLAVIIPATKKDHIVRYVVIVSFIASWLWDQFLPSDSTKTIILTLLISTLAACLFPRKETS